MSLLPSSEPLRVWELEMHNFRAFRGASLPLKIEGQNILIFGENGSGKTSVWAAFEQFFDASINRNRKFENSKNQRPFDEVFGVFLTLSQLDGSGFIPLKWSDEDTPSGNTDCENIARSCFCLDYRALWKTYFNQRGSTHLDLWKPLIETLLAHARAEPHLHDFEGGFGAWWQQLKANAATQIPAKRSEREDTREKRQQVLEEEWAQFQTAWDETFDQVKQLARLFLNELSRGLNLSCELQRPELTETSLGSAISFSWSEPQLILNVDWETWKKPFENYPEFLNESRLCALSLSIYLAAAYVSAQNAPTRLKILALDDVLIGFDMSNRMPVLEILDAFFDDFQIVLTTYDRAWFDLARMRLNKERWKTFECRAQIEGDEEILVVRDGQGPLERAKNYLNLRDNKAAAVYVRSHFEVLIKQFCNDNGFLVPFALPGKHLTTKPFWDNVILARFDEGDRLVVEPNLQERVNKNKNRVLNPLAHSSNPYFPLNEIQEAIDAVTLLEERFQAAKGKKLHLGSALPPKTLNELKQAHNNTGLPLRGVTIALDKLIQVLEKRVRDPRTPM